MCDKARTFQTTLTNNVNNLKFYWQGIVARIAQHLACIDCNMCVVYKVYTSQALSHTSQGPGAGTRRQLQELGTTLVDELTLNNPKIIAQNRM